MTAPPLALGAGAPILFVDLDGTVRHGKDELGHFVNSPDDVVIFPEAIDQLAAWRAAGGMVFGVTNQGGVGLGHISHRTHDAICRATMKACDDHIGDVFACVHRPDAGCWCRKPLPGLIFGVVDALRHVGKPPPSRETCLMVGDRPEDEQAAAAAGVAFLDAAAWRAGAPHPGRRS